MLKQLQTVLDRAHRGHRYIRDADQYHRPEHWTVSLTGDCEDFSLHCRQELAAKGIDSDLVLCRTETGEGHLVCSVAGYVLDNRHKWVKRRDDLPYQWISLGKPDGTWHAIIG
jgi:predicted transglutaminase-like cysteine proteinase